MTPEIEELKTNEFLRRRKLRIQQVREQSKDIAKKIRQRASAEKFRGLIDLDTTKGKVYLEQQDQLVKKLEHLYAKSLDNVGASHKKAATIILQEDKPEKTDLSKQRARTAAAELRRNKQEKLDERKKSLDRKLIAREIANEISREKSTTLANKVVKESTVKTTEESVQAEKVETLPGQTSTSDLVNNEKNKSKVTGEMGTQWDYETVPNQWEPHVPALFLPKEDSTKESSPKNVESKSDKNKRLNLFALSDEMPSSLRGGLTSLPEESLHSSNKALRSSLTMVSDYLQHRDLRLREPDAVPKKSSEDLQSIKQTILRTRASKGEVKNTHVERPNKLRHVESGLAKKSSVTMYNHSTRDVKDVPFGDERLVMRDLQTDEDAFSQAMKETSSETTSKEKDYEIKLQEMRNKIAVTKQNVEKDYKDTMAFLKTMPKDKFKPIKNAYKDDKQQQMQKENRQRKLQQEYTKIRKDCRRHSHVNPKVSSKKSKSPVTVDSDNDFDSKDFQYSWMPVPESDGNLAIHTIPTTLKENKSGNTVKFSRIDSYHEYRSRHKHTPPTKDTSYQEKKKQMFLSDENDNDDTTQDSDTSSIENLQLEKSKEKKGRDDGKLSDAERIIIYKILDTKSNKSADNNSKAIKDIAKSLSLMTKNRTNLNIPESDNTDKPRSNKKKGKVEETRVSFEQLKEGVYKTVNDSGDNMASLHLPESPHERSGVKGENGEKAIRSEKCSTQLSCSCDSRQVKCSLHHPSASTSTSSFKTATNDKATSLPDNDVGNEVSANPKSDFIKLVDEKGQASENFYIGATGFLKDDAYEVIIQLRKKDAAKTDGKGAESEVEDKTTSIKQNVEPPPTPKQSSMQKLSQVNEQTSSKADSNRIEIQCPEYVSDATENQISENQMEEQLITNVDFDNIPPKDPYQGPSYVNQGVYMSGHGSYVIPSTFTKASSIEKPANSVGTQTTLGSPVQRPAFIHMSSSTSTAYMSPPEYIMPSFMRHREKLDSISDEPSDILNYGVMSNDQEYGKRYADSVFARYAHAGKIALKTSKTSVQSPKKGKHKNKLKPPPNTARSTASGYVDHNIIDYCRRKMSLANSCPKTKKICNKYVRRQDSNLCSKTHSRKSKLSIPSLKGSGKNSIVNSNRQINSMLSRPRSLGNYGSTAYGKVGKYDLNPVVKWYVDKLLKLNKDGLKAINVANQECSVVATPGSSIIDVRHNINRNKPMAEAKISLKQIKDTLTQQVLDEYNHRQKAFMSYDSLEHTGIKGVKIFKKLLPRIPKKKSVHKVKSLNISRNLVSGKIDTWQTSAANFQSSVPVSDTSSSPKNVEDCFKSMPSVPHRSKSRSKSSPSPRRIINDKENNKYSSHTIKIKSSVWDKENTRNNNDNKIRHQQYQRTAMVSCSDSDPTSAPVRQQAPSISPPPLHISTQTNRLIDDEINYIKLAESKLQNMEKIADLTEKCTKRLSNLAKVLDEVRKNKSIYNRVSDSASDNDQLSAKNLNTQLSSTLYKPIPNIKEKEMTPVSIESVDYPSSENVKVEKNHIKNTGFVPFLKDIPKPNTITLISPERATTSNIRSSNIMTPEHQNMKNRGKPPPALSRILKRAPEIVPHELSTVIEVDSPLSTKRKSQIEKNDSNTKHNASSASDSRGESTEEVKKNNDHEEQNNNPDLVQSNANLSRRQTKISLTEYSDETKLKMMDLKKFNEIMLKPFISIQEYAKQCNVGNMEDPSNIEKTNKDDAINDELSSLHSDGSLPDVIAELLKRNIINEPFKFDTASNVNSTTVSSESTMSILALSKMKKDKKKSSYVFSNKENIAETSDTLSVSSNPDLENAFKKLGMGWASSTLKKTKERLALSSSSNTSSSSLSQFKLKTVNNEEFPVLLTDSISTSNAALAADSTKNAEQQTSKINSMTVKQFLNNELAKKITFSNKSRKNDTEEDEFLSLYETKMPEEMKHTSKMVREERSIDSNIRARTSTPVQIFKSTTYHSSSSSNMSNGLFSNADDLSSVKGTSNSMRNHSTSDKDDLTIPNFSLRTKKGVSDCSKSE